MKILVIGKCPPIQGGVSPQTFATCLELARRGHAVDLVTNADEVEPIYRHLFLEGDHAYATGAQQPGFRRHAVTPLGQFGFVPSSPEFGSRLLGKALAVVESSRPDFIVGWYFQPYGLVAAQVAQTHGIPYGLVHAGSDLSRLAQHQDLRPAFAWMARSATAVFTDSRADVQKALADLGVPGSRCRATKGLGPLHRAFPDSPAFDWDALQRNSAEHFLSYPLERGLVQRLGELNEKPFERARPTIGVYGKVGEARGSYDLLEGLADLAERGVRFNFVSLTAGWPRAIDRFLTRILDQTALASRSWIFPPIAPWRIRGYLDHCDVVCYLERGLDVAYHFSLVPLEVLSSGTCLLCSREMASKPLYGRLVRHDRNALVIEDPRDVKGLARCLEEILADSERRSRLAQQGFLDAAALFERLDKLGLCRDGVADAIEAVAGKGAYRES